MIEASDDALVALLNAGDNQAFAEIYKRYCRPLFVTCLRTIRPKGKVEDAQEIVSTTFVKLYQRRDKMRSMASVTNFLYLALRTGSIDFLRKAGRNIEISQDMLELQAANDELDGALLERVLREKQILQLVEDLPNRSREVVILYYLEGKKYREIGELLNISPLTVKNQLRYALQKLRAVLASKETAGILLLITAGLIGTMTFLLLDISGMLSLY